jgi:pheromone shutdown-related protein TraB
MKFKNLTIVGTSHISASSIDEIKKKFSSINPDFIALELDKRRLLSLMTKDDKKHTYLTLKTVGIKGYLFGLIGSYIQKKLGQVVKVKPGSDMITALKLAQKNKKQIFLIDRDILITLKRFSKAISWKEKFKIFYSLVAAPFSKKKIRIDLSKVPEQALINRLLKELKKEFPNIYTVLVAERNKFMAHNLLQIMKHNPESKILAVVGAGHEKDIYDIIKSKF